jgi:iduronate 2-sulfatase
MKTGLLSALLFVSVFNLRAADKPNILLLLVDDLKPTIGCYGDEAAITPNIDRLAARGMRFDAAYCNQAVCAPSRFTLMLGSHSTSTGLYGLGSPLRQILPDAVTLPQYFSAHGYRTESLGKVFHIGHGNEGDPASFSVPHFKDKVIEYVDPDSTDGGKLTREEALFTNQQLGNIRALPRGAAFESPVAEDEDYADGRVAAETIKRLQAAKNRCDKKGTPFFIASGFVRPHLPFSAPKKYWDMYDPDKLPKPVNEDFPKDAPSAALKRGGEIAAYKPIPTDRPIDKALQQELIHGYYASTTFADAQIGKVLDELDRLDLSRNTIVVLWGDHGFHLGDLGIWTKHTNYEQANRIPIILVAPGVAAPGSATTQPAGSVDIYPTLAELAGLPAPKGPQPMDGISLVPVLKNPAERVRNHAFHAYPKSMLGRAIRTERYRMVEWSRGDEVAYELYDYQEDPHETANQAEHRPEVMAELKAILEKYPEPVSKAQAKKKLPAKTSAQVIIPDNAPKIDHEALLIVAEVNVEKDTSGVVLAQGGREHGYALHYIDGKAAWDLRVNGKVTRVMASTAVRGGNQLVGYLTKERFYLTVNGELAEEKPSPGLIPVQPKDGFNVGQDLLSAAGDYEAPNPFTGTIISTRVQSRAAPAIVAPALSPEQIRAGLNAHDQALYIKEGWIRDPHIVRGSDNYYYLTGTTTSPEDGRLKQDPYNTGLGHHSLVGWRVQVWRSKDLVEWEALGAPYTLEDGIWFKEQPEAFVATEKWQWRLWAPELHQLDDGRWALVHTSPSPVKGANLSLSTGPDIKGPWTNPMGTSIGKRHDPSLFKDDDGAWWMVWGATEIARLKPDFSGFETAPMRIGPSGETAKMGHEGCLIQKHFGKYMLFGTGWSTGKGRRGSYNLYYAVADEITGPYSERKFAGRFLGHGTPFQAPDGQWWCTAFYNGNVPPLPREGIESRDLSVTAQTINHRGTTIVPMEVVLQKEGGPFIHAVDPAYWTPGPDEAQKF